MILFTLCLDFPYVGKIFKWIRLSINFLSLKKKLWIICYFCIVLWLEDSFFSERVTGVIWKTCGWQRLHTSTCDGMISLGSNRYIGVLISFSVNCIFNCGGASLLAIMVGEGCKVDFMCLIRQRTFQRKLLCFLFSEMWLFSHGALS